MRWSLIVIELCGYEPRAEGPRSLWLLRRVTPYFNSCAAEIHQVFGRSRARSDRNFPS